jgi:uncharacterized OsmC-like protein
MDLINIKRGSRNEVTIRIRGHELTSDWSPAEGGDDLGLSPSEMLVASIGSCISMVVSQYCKRHGFSDGPIEVNLTYEMSSNPNRISAITVDLEVHGDIPESKKDIILKLAKKCPIHQTLMNPPNIDIDILSGP